MIVNVHHRAVKQYLKLNEPILSKVAVALDDLEYDPPKGGIVYLTGTKNSYRRDVDWLRILFNMENNEILVTDIIPRGQAYTKKTMKEKK